MTDINIKPTREDVPPALGAAERWLTCYSVPERWLTCHSVPEVTFEEADTIARNTFGHSMISPDFVEKVLLILEDDRAHVADLQDSWVEVPEGATIPEGTLYRVEFPQGGASEHISVEPMVSKSNLAFVRKSDCPRLTIPKSRRERIVEEMAAGFLQVYATFVIPPPLGDAEKWLTCYEAAVKVVDGDA